MLKLKITLLVMNVISCFDDTTIFTLCINIGLIFTQFASLKFEANQKFQTYQTLCVSVQLILITLFNKELVVSTLIYFLLINENVQNQKMLQTAIRLGISVLMIMSLSNSLIDYLRNSVFAIGLLSISMKTEGEQELNYFQQQISKATSPRFSQDNYGVMLIDLKDKNNVYMNDYLQRRLGKNQIKISKVDQSSRQKLECKVNGMDLNDLLEKFQFKKLHHMKILKSDQLSDHLINIDQDDNNSVRITFYDVKERDEYQKRIYLYQIMKQLFTTVSHEFGTLLNFVLAIAQVAIDKYPQQQYYYSIKSTCEIMHHFVMDMVDYNDIIGNQFKLQLAPLDINDLLESVTSLFEVQCREKQLKLEFQNHVLDCLKINSDQRRIKQIIIHLLANAQKFTVKGSIKLEAMQIDENTIKFIVTDTGVGMNEQEEYNLRQMLTLDFKSEKQISPKTAGFGLGCYLSNKLCMHLSNYSNGLQFKANKQGATFWFIVSNNVVPESNILNGIHQINKYQYVDLKQSQLEKTVGKKISRMNSRISYHSSPKIFSLNQLTDPIKENTESIINEELNSGERKSRIHTLNRNIKKQIKFLIVDDEMINILGLQLILKRMNIQADHAFNGVECLQIMEKNHHNYSAIFMDINMPLLDGYETSKKLVQKYGQQIKIIACTAYTDSDTKQKCYNTGMSYFLNKPVSVVELQKILMHFSQ